MTPAEPRRPVPPFPEQPADGGDGQTRPTSAADPAAVQIAVVCDDHYACQLAVMLLSLFDHSRTCAVQVHVLVPEHFAGKARIDDALADNAHRLRYYNIAEEGIGGLKSRDDITNTTYYRLRMGDVLPPAVRRVIYLDCDMIIRADIAELWRTPLSDKIVAAAPDPAFDKWHILGLPDHAPYFNAGVLLVDLDRWREKRIGAAALAFAASCPERLSCQDQCALNWVLRDRWVLVDSTWNVQMGHFGDVVNGQTVYARRLAPLAAAARIVHFNAPGRPWLYMDEHPCKTEYLAYKKRTPWRAERPADLFPHNVIVKNLRRYAPACLPAYLYLRRHVY